MVRDLYGVVSSGLSRGSSSVVGSLRLPVFVPFSPCLRMGGQPRHFRGASGFHPTTVSTDMFPSLTAGSFPKRPLSVCKTEILSPRTAPPTSHTSPTSASLSSCPGRPGRCPVCVTPTPSLRYQTDRTDNQ